MYVWWQFCCNYASVPCMMYHIELRFITNQNSSAPLLAADVDSDQEKEEEGESYEVEVITNHPRESSMNWHEEMDDFDEVKQYCNNPTYI